jgi:hypothetical protein
MGDREDFPLSLAFAEAALPVWDQAHPQDIRPWLGIVAARAWLQNPTEATSRAAVDDGAAVGRAIDEAAQGDIRATWTGACTAARAAEKAALWTDVFAGEAGVKETTILRASAREVASTPLELFVTAELH